MAMLKHSRGARVRDRRVVASRCTIGVPSHMAPNPSSPPVLFDRALLRVRQGRAAKLGMVPFLLDRVAEDMAERLQAVLRTFQHGADVGTPGDRVRRALAAR